MPGLLCQSWANNCFTSCWKCRINITISQISSVLQLCLPPASPCIPGEWQCSDDSQRRTPLQIRDLPLNIFPGVCDEFLQGENVYLTYSSLCCPKLLSPHSNKFMPNKVHPPKSHVEKHPIPISYFPQRKHWKPKICAWTLHTQIRGALLPCPQTRKDQMKSNSYL